MDWSSMNDIVMMVLKIVLTLASGYALKKAPEFTKKQFDSLEAKSNNETWLRFLSTCEYIILSVEQTALKSFKKANEDKVVTKDEWTEIYAQCRREAEEKIIEAIETMLPESMKGMAKKVLPSILEGTVAKVKMGRGGGVAVNPS